MQIDDFDGNAITVNTETELLARLRYVRRGRYGAFFLYHAARFPALSVQINGEIAYLHYFPVETHPGYQPRDLTPDGCPAEVHFLQPDGSEAESFDMPDYAIVAADAAYVAAIEFFNSRALPPSISWLEL